VFHIQCDARLGSAASLLWWAMAAGATRWVGTHEADKVGAKGAASWQFGTCAKLAGALHMLSWYMQLHPAFLETRECVCLCCA